MLSAGRWEVREVAAYCCSKRVKRYPDDRPGDWPIVQVVIALERRRMRMLNKAYDDLLNLFWTVANPLGIRQGGDVEIQLA